MESVSRGTSCRVASALASVIPRRSRPMGPTRSMQFARLSKRRNEVLAALTKLHQVVVRPQVSFPDARATDTAELHRQRGPEVPGRPDAQQADRASRAGRA